MDILEGYDNLGRPIKDLFFMDLCFVISKRSIDTSSKFGCVAVHEDGTVLSMGYNNPVRGFLDEETPTERPYKYNFFEHAERNCIYNAARSGICLKDSVFYIGGFPCVDCLRAMIQVGAKKIIYGPLQAMQIKDMFVYEDLLVNQNIIIHRFDYDDALFEENPRAKKMVKEKEEQGLKGINFEYYNGLIFSKENSF